MMVKVVDLKEIMYSENTGKFSYLSSKGMLYIIFHSDANYIFDKPMKNRSEDQIILTYQKIFERMNEAKLGVKKHILDNEISENYKKAIKENKVKHELVPPEEH